MKSRARKILRRLLRRAGMRVVEGRDSLLLPAGQGRDFDMEFSENFHEYTVRAAGWEGHFIKSNLHDALNCFLYALTHHCRVKVFSRGGVSYKWQLQFREKGKWVVYTTRYSLLYPFWKRLRVRYLSNDAWQEFRA